MPYFFCRTLFSQQKRKVVGKSKILKRRGKSREATNQLQQSNVYNKQYWTIKNEAIIQTTKDHWAKHREWGDKSSRAVFFKSKYEAKTQREIGKCCLSSDLLQIICCSTFSLSPSLFSSFSQRAHTLSVQYLNKYWLVLTRRRGKKLIFFSKSLTYIYTLVDIDRYYECVSIRVYRTVCYLYYICCIVYVRLNFFGVFVYTIDLFHLMKTSVSTALFRCRCCVYVKLMRLYHSYTHQMPLLTA